MERVGSNFGSGSTQQEAETGGEERAQATDDVQVGTQQLSLPPHTPFSGEGAGNDGAFDRWVRKLERYADLAKWSPSEKLAQLELHLTRKAECIFELLPSET